MSFQVDAPVVDVEAAMSQITQLVSAGASGVTEKLTRALWLVSSLTLVLDLGAALYHPAIGPVFGGHKVAYYGTLAGVLAVVDFEMVTAYLLPCAGAQLSSFAKALLRFAVLLLLVIVAVGGYGLTIKA